MESVAVAATVPFGNVSLGRAVRPAEARAAPAGSKEGGLAAHCRFNAVGADYFRALGIPMLRGRPFTRAEAESEAAPRVAILDEVAARKLWPDQDPIGRRVVFDGADTDAGKQPMEVAGIVPSLRDEMFQDRLEPHVYVRFGQHFQSTMNIHLRSSLRGDRALGALLESIRREIRTYDPKLPVLALRTLSNHLDESLSLWLVRTAARMFTIFGALALFLAVVGVYGVKAYTVARRTREIVIRMALGATQRDALWLVVKDGMLVTGAGLGVGTLLSIGVGQLVGKMLYQVSPTDPLVLAAAPLVLAASALLASYLPARRAARVDPMTALRTE